MFWRILLVIYCLIIIVKGIGSFFSSDISFIGSLAGLISPLITTYCVCLVADQIYRKAKSAEYSFMAILASYLIGIPVTVLFILSDYHFSFLGLSYTGEDLFYLIVIGGVIGFVSVMEDHGRKTF